MKHVLILAELIGLVTNLLTLIEQFGLLNIISATASALAVTVLAAVLRSERLPDRPAVPQ